MPDHAATPNRLALRTPSDGLTHEAVCQTDVTTQAGYKDFLARLPGGEVAVRQSFYAAMKFKEQQLIEKTFATAIGATPPYPQIGRDELVNSLVEDYRVFGIAEGRNSAEHLIKKLEAATRRQALAVDAGQTR